MAKFEEVGPGKPVVESIRVDKVSPYARRAGVARALVVIADFFDHADPSVGNGDYGLQNTSPMWSPVRRSSSSSRRSKVSCFYLRTARWCRAGAWLNFNNVRRPDR